MNERPILFSAPMVRAILAGAKTQTRRLVKPQPTVMQQGWMWVCKKLLAGYAHTGADALMRLMPPLCPYGQPGDRLWVREAFIHEPADYCWEASVSIPCRPASTVYRADQEGDTRGAGWKPSIHMPRSLSRITLEVTGVRVERLQDISEVDARAEGAPEASMPMACMYLQAEVLRSRYREGFAALWESIHGPGSWDANPWVWVVQFRRVEAVR